MGEENEKYKTYIKNMQIAIDKLSKLTFDFMKHLFILPAC